MHLDREFLLMDEKAGLNAELEALKEAEKAYKAQVENLTDNVQGLEQDLIALQVCAGVYSYCVDVFMFV
jgi:cell division protein FtsB